MPSRYLYYRGMLSGGGGIVIRLLNTIDLSSKGREKTQRGFCGIAISKPAKTRNTTKRYQSGEIIYH